MVANILAGFVDFNPGGRVSLEQALIARDQWRDGHLSTAPRNWVITNPQFIDPNPAVVLTCNARQVAPQTAQADQRFRLEQSGFDHEQQRGTAGDGSRGFVVV